MNTLFYILRTACFSGPLLSILMGCQPDAPDDMQHNYINLCDSAHPEYCNHIYYCPKHPTQLDQYPSECPLCGDTLIVMPEWEPKKKEH